MRAAYVINRALRLTTLLLFAVACGLLVHRLRRTPEQKELTRYVEVELPALFAQERPIDEKIETLNDARAMKPEAARHLLVEEVIPALIRHRKQAATLELHTGEVRRLHQGYLAMVDQIIDGCRSCVRVIDDPKIPGPAGLVLVRERFADVRRAFLAWDEELRRACVRHRLAKPGARPTQLGQEP